MTENLSFLLIYFLFVKGVSVQYEHVKFMTFRLSKTEKKQVLRLYILCKDLLPDSVTPLNYFCRLLTLKAAHLMDTVGNKVFYSKVI